MEQNKVNIEIEGVLDALEMIDGLGFLLTHTGVKSEQFNSNSEIDGFIGHIDRIGLLISSLAVGVAGSLEESFKRASESGNR